MFGLANPDRFLRFTRPLAPAAWALAGVLLALGAWLAFTAPEDFRQGDTVRIMFVHVPAASVGLGIYLALGVSSFFALVFRHPLADAAARAAAVLGLVGLINLPIVKFSVDWWNTLHQPASLLRADGPSMSAVYLTPLLVMMAAWGALFLAIWLTAIRTEIVRRRVLTIRARRAQEA